MPPWSPRLVSLRALLALGAALFLYSVWVAAGWHRCKIVHWVRLPGDEYLGEGAGGEAWYRLRHQHDAAAVFFARLRFPEVRCPALRPLTARHAPAPPLCAADHFLPVSPCLVLSFAIGQRTASDAELALRHDCAVHVFDPLLADLSPERHPRLSVFRLCLGAENSDQFQPPERLLDGGDRRQRWGVRTYRALLEEARAAGHVVDLVRLSVAGMEFAALDEMLRGNHLRSVKQLLVQFHTDVRRRENYFRHLDLLVRLGRSGFRVFHARANRTRVPCVQGYCDVHSVGLINVYHDA